MAGCTGQQAGVQYISSSNLWNVHVTCLLWAIKQKCHEDKNYRRKAWLLWWQWYVSHWLLCGQDFSLSHQDIQGLTFLRKCESMCIGRTVPGAQEEMWQENQPKTVAARTIDALPIGGKEKKACGPLKHVSLLTKKLFNLFFCFNCICCCFSRASSCIIFAGLFLFKNYLLLS